MRRRLFASASVLSLLLSMTTAVLWVRGHWTQDFAWKGSGGGDAVMVYSAWGRLNVFVAGRYPQAGRWGVASEPVSGVNSYAPAFGVPSPNAVDGRHILGVHFMRTHGWLALPGAVMSSSTPAVRVICLGFSWLWIAGLFALLPLANGLGLVHRYRLRKSDGTCRQCGYNLTGNASGVCPECGTAIPQSAEAKA